MVSTSIWILLHVYASHLTVPIVTVEYHDDVELYYVSGYSSVAQYQLSAWDSMEHAIYVSRKSSRLSSLCSC
jgi:hypothetical protein